MYKCTEAQLNQKDKVISKKDQNLEKIMQKTKLKKGIIKKYIYQKNLRNYLKRTKNEIIYLRSETT